MNKIRFILVGILAAGVFLTGIGTGVALREYSELEYTGEYVIDEKNIVTKQGEVEFGEKNEDGRYRIHCYTEDYEMVEDASVPENVVRYEALYNKENVVLSERKKAEQGAFSLVSHWKNDASFKNIMLCKDKILKDLKQNKIRNYKSIYVQKVKLVVNPKMANLLDVSIYG